MSRAEPLHRAPVWCVASLTNHAELVDVLGLASQAPDEDVVRAAVERWGSASAPRLRGAWAYAVQEGRPGVVSITRDHVGAMPAYWTRDSSGTVQVSDSIAELARLEGVDLAPDAHYACAVDLRIPGLVTTRTGAVGIHRVPPGSTVSVGPSEERVRAWWVPDAVPRVRRIRVDDAAEQLRHLLRSAVDDAVDGAARQGELPMAAHVSGGIDSTTVAFLAQESMNRRGESLACALSWSPAPEAELPQALIESDLAYDERILVRDLAAQLGIPVVFGPLSMVDAPWLGALTQAVQPQSTLSRESHLLPQMQALGVRTVFSGWGGDEFASFNGRSVNRALVRGMRWGPLRDAHGDLRGRGLGRTAAARALIREGLPSLGRGGGAPDHVIRRDGRARAAAATFPEVADAYWRSQAAFAKAKDPRAFQLALLQLGHLSRRIESWHEAGRRFGVRYRYPLLDLRLVEWALSMPPEVFRVGAHSRRVFRIALDGLVPEQIRMTTKDDPVLLALIGLERERARRG